MEQEVKTREETKVFLHREDAIKFVRKSYRPGLFHFVRGGAFLYKDGSDNKQGWDWSCWLKVSQKDAITYIQQIIPNCLAQEATIQLTLSEDKYAPCLFIG